eukprot:CAMPEP_0177644866 /NCGR_PEP_ID=MMETSP0447-20121125/8928_1 /TAXON_ID=0 /ORGANISM="Stygamoeba regulata, Strain BSH-02190019" /LENGTH=168 /DNA_ID=CAMNT_0019147279 /DNA_START=92 /DNA_END=595 /DNA_ORIENTATION=-
MTSWAGTEFKGFMWNGVKGDRRTTDQVGGDSGKALDTDLKTRNKFYNKDKPGTAFTLEDQIRSGKDQPETNFWGDNKYQGRDLSQTAQPLLTHAVKCAVDSYVQRIESASGKLNPALLAVVQEVGRKTLDALQGQPDETHVALLNALPVGLRLRVLSEVHAIMLTAYE